ncbi:MAG: LysM peptidoglycan-binding domain-containing protein [Deltaproteobacteria bacterium]|nr:LysM peptidoglycan-binding domain-containing protein [Deltaproteobacteria bacterium]
MGRYIRFIACIFILFSLTAGESVARPGRSSAFKEPDALRPRINFWIDVFTRYGKHTMVFHHRDYPQIVFDVVHNHSQAEKLSEKQYARYQKKIKQDVTDRINASLSHLGKGRSPRNDFERSIVSKMAFLSGGNSKYNTAVSKKLVRVQTGIKEKFRASVMRSGRYLRTIEEIFKSYDLPLELTRLPFVESSFNYKAYSSAGAAGIWQFMPRTGRLFGLRITSAVDERRDPVTATHAAAKYLKSAYEELGSWPLALTSYNHGIYGVKKAVKLAGTKDIAKIIEHSGKRRFGFASNNFYPEFLAALEVFEHYKDYFPGVQVERTLRFDRIRLEHPFTVSHVRSQLALSSDDLKPYNYAISSRAWDSRVSLPKGYVLNVPAGHGFKAAKLRSPQVFHNSSNSVPSGDSYRVRSGDSLIRIAKNHGISVSKLKALNDLNSDRIRIGQYLVVAEKEKSSPKAMAALTSTGHYKVRSGDTLSEIASHFGTSIDDIKANNGLSSNQIRVGQSLKVNTTNQTEKTTQAKQYAANSARPKVYKVQRGDSLWTISRKFRVQLADLKRVNNLSRSHIRIGDSLVLP